MVSAFVASVRRVPSRWIFIHASAPIAFPLAQLSLVTGARPATPATAAPIDAMRSSGPSASSSYSSAIDSRAVGDRLPCSSGMPEPGGVHFPVATVRTITWVTGVRSRALDRADPVPGAKTRRYRPDARRRRMRPTISHDAAMLRRVSALSTAGSARRATSRRSRAGKRRRRGDAGEARINILGAETHVRAASERVFAAN